MPATDARSWLRHVRGAVANLEPYAWEMSSAQVASTYGVPLDRIVRFDTNTSPFAPTNVAASLVGFAEHMPLNEYPDTSYQAVVDELVGYTGFPAGQIIVGCGADEIIDMIVKSFVEAGRRVVTSRPSYTMYGVLTEMYGGTLVAIDDGPDLSRDIDGIIRAAGNADLVLLCNPNNPTGNLIAAEDLVRIAKSVSCPVIVDEAYFEFCGSTVATEIARFPHVVAVRTLSKAFSMAGLRVGYALVSSEMAGVLNRVRPPNSVGTMSVTLAAAALRDQATMRARVAAILAEKVRFADLLRVRTERVYPSATNFLLARFRDPGAAVAALLRHGLVPRDVSSKPGLAGCLRVTTRLPEENDRFVAALATIA
ncbi:MAG: histidinol-phosphate transaminase [Chloroflexota bacterium]|nr:MAG: histidinol-phosphate transaminase [Chloroflexota bacterium]